MSLRLACFALLLLPPFMRIAWGYCRDPRLRRGIRFGPKRGNLLDIYVPEEAVAAQEGRGPPVPVVVAIMGGAWVIGYRAWNAQLGRRLMDAGVLVVAVDYRNFPFASVPDMVEDLDRGIAWVFSNIASYGGDPGNVVITGQSAGAHLSALLLAERSLAEARAEVEGTEPGCGGDRQDGGRWSVRDVRAYVGVSGPYDLDQLAAHLDTKWMGPLTRPMLLNRMCPGGDLAASSPARLVRSDAWRNAAATGAVRMPPVLLFHGQADKTVPMASSVEFAKALHDAGIVDVAVDARPGLAHAEPIIEGPMRGEDHQVQLLLPYCFGGAGSQERLDAMPRLRPMYPRRVINAASWIMPF